MGSSLVDLVQRGAEREPDRVAFRFLGDGGDDRVVTCRELWERSAAVGSALMAESRPGDRALLLFPPGIDYIVALFGCSYAGVVAVPAYPPNPVRLQRTLPRLDAICADAQASIALTTPEILPLVGSFGSMVHHLGRLRWLAPSADGRADPRRSHDVAILQYTSGSTSDPKGVVLGHDNLLANLEQIRVAFRQTPETRGVFWLPPYHDMGLVGAILEPVYAGYPAVLMSPEAFLTRPLRWLRAVSDHAATTSGGPNFAYELCIRKTTPEERAALDLSAWSVAFNGAEPVRADTLDRFAAAFAVAGFRRSALLSCYGLAEATLLVSCGQVGAGPDVVAVDEGALGEGRLAPGDRPMVSAGQAAPGTVVAIVAQDGTVVGDGRVGEVCVSGPNVARGYWGNPSHPAFATTLPDWPGRTFLRTGDLGASVDGELIITGRSKDLLLVRGRNVYPQDLEHAAERAHPALRQGGSAAFADDPESADPRIVVVCEVERSRSEVDAEEIGRAVRRAVVERCDVQVASVVLVEAGALPKTSSGKVRRRTTRAELAAGSLRAVGASSVGPRALQGPSRDDVLAAAPAARPALVEQCILAAAARRGAAAVDGPLHLLDLVADSIGAVEIAADLERELGVAVSLSEVLADGSVADLAARLAERLEGARPAAAPADPTVLSAGQAALWVTQKLAPSSSAFNVTAALRLCGRLDPVALARAVEAVGQRHLPLRTAIGVQDGRPYAVPAAVPPLERLVGAAEHDPIDEVVERWASAPFDLDRGPLWRVGWVDRREPVLILCAHHLVADYASLHVLLADLERAYVRGALPPLAADYATFVAADADRMAQDAPGRRAFWRDQLAGAPTLDLPASARPPRPTYRAVQREISLPPGTVRALRAFARAERATLHAVLLAGLAAVLHRWTGQRDLVIGTPVTARHNAAAGELVGYCVNPLPVRAHPSPEVPFVGLVREIRDRVRAGIAHELPLPQIAELVSSPRDTARSPVFQALFALERAPDASPGVLVPDGRRGRFADLDVEALPVRPSHVAFDLVVLVEETRAGVTAAFQVSLDALDADAASRLAEHWVTLLGHAVETPDEAIGRLPMLTPAERRFLVEEVNRTAAPIPTGRLHELVAAQAARTPDAVAVIDGTREVTYRELLARAGAIAQALHAVGPMREARVGLYLDRSADTVAAVLGALAAGAAYVYLDPRYPADRVGFVAEDAQLTALVTRAGLRGRVPPTGAAVLELEQVPPTGALPAAEGTAEDLAYVIYTSGSTGRPKGVAIEHRNAAALIGWALAEYEPALLAGTLAATSLAFDLSVFELFAPLSCGGTVIVAESALELPHLPARERVTLINTVPSAMTALIAAEGVPSSVRVVNLAGEPLTAALAEAVHALPQVERLYNLYGPTEDTTYSTFEQVERGATPTLGRPLANRAAYVMDPLGQPVPVGVVGEIWLGGAGVTRGYLGRPDLTAERFVDSPLPEVTGRMYRTGDLGRRRADGRIEYLGRRDRQIKLRGFRIELGEIVAALLAHPGVADAAVLADAEQRLLAFVAAPSVDPEALRAHLEARLPPFMVPNRIAVLDRLPLTPNGKIDHAALSAPAAPSGEGDAAGAPLDPTQAAVAEIWREVLGVVPGLHDDFFALGGHSLLAAQVHARLKVRFGADLPLSVVFEHPTLERLSRAVAAGAGAGARIRASRRGTRRFEELAPARKAHAGPLDLGKLHAALAADPHVSASAVLALPNRQLIAFVEAPAGSEAALHARLEQELPPHLLPSRVVRLDRLPADPFGAGRATLAGAAGVPELVDPIESVLLTIWAEVLGVEARRDDDFFALGGHSLLAARVAARVRERLGVQLPLSALFEHPTVERLAASVARAATATPRSIQAVPRGPLRFDDLSNGRPR